ncbi:MAG: sirohydrochlorin cobaltochelatase, partial [Tissierellia bacterium]|nr:sirohydrochlorin cobaltochelatase [Tissierellia bacterium]
MKKGIIVTSFGTSNRETMELCIESIENRIKERYTDYLVTRA